MWIYLTIAKQKLILQLPWGFEIKINWSENMHKMEKTVESKDMGSIANRIDASEAHSNVYNQHDSTRHNVIYKSQPDYVLFVAPFSSVLKIPIFLSV